MKLADIAKAAGVSQGTASNVFSRPDVVRKEVRERVLAIAKEMGYRGPDVKGRLLRAGRVNAVGVATMEPIGYFFEDPWARSLMAAIGNVCDTTRMGLSLVSGLNREKLAWNINSAVVDGYILLCVGAEEELVRLTRERKLPFIAISMRTQDPTVPQIHIDNQGAAYAAAKHLTELGHRQFAILGIGMRDVSLLSPTPEEVEASMKLAIRDRAYGYWQALAEVGIDREAVPIRTIPGSKRDVEAALDALLALPQPPTALLAMSDRVALWAMEVLQERGLSVPNDLSIIGFDGVPEAAMCTPGLTTLAQPFDDIARVAVASVTGGRGVPTEPLTVPLMVRGSTAPPLGCC